MASRNALARRRRTSEGPRGTSPPARAGSTSASTRLTIARSWRWRLCGSICGAGRSGSGTPRKSKTSGRHLAQALVEQQHPSGDLFARGLVGVLVGDPEEARGRARASAAAGSPSRAETPCASKTAIPRARQRSSELEAESALPEPGLADDADDLRVPADRPLERRFESRHLVRSGRRSARSRATRDDLERRAQRAHSLELVDAHRLHSPP